MLELLIGTYQLPMSTLRQPRVSIPHVWCATGIQIPCDTKTECEISQLWNYLLPNLPRQRWNDFIFNMEFSKIQLYHIYICLGITYQLMLSCQYLQVQRDFMSLSIGCLTGCKLSSRCSSGLWKLSKFSTEFFWSIYLILFFYWSSSDVFSISVSS